MPRPDWKPFGGLVQHPGWSVRRLFDVRQSSLAVNIPCMRHALHPSARAPLNVGWMESQKSKLPRQSSLCASWARNRGAKYCAALCFLWLPDCGHPCLEQPDCKLAYWTDLAVTDYCKLVVGGFTILWHRKTAALQRLITYKWDNWGFKQKGGRRRKKKVKRGKKIDLISSPSGKHKIWTSPNFTACIL